MERGLKGNATLRYKGLRPPGAWTEGSKGALWIKETAFLSAQLN